MSTLERPSERDSREKQAPSSLGSHPVSTIGADVAHHSARLRNTLLARASAAWAPALGGWQPGFFSPSDLMGRAQRVFKDVRKIGLLAGPLLAQYVIAHSSHMIDTSFIGRLDDPVLLSSMVLGGSLAMATGYSVVCGLASASETLSGQAHGAANSRALAATLQRSLGVCSAALVPITALWWNAEPILLQLGQAPEVAAGAARYLALTLPALYSYMVFDCVDKHLLAQGVVAPGVAITAVSTALTPLYCWYFVNHLGLQLDGAAYAYVCSQLTSTALTLGYLGYRSVRTAGTPEEVPLAPTAAALANWAPYLQLAVPATIMACMEGWAVEVLIFLSGHLPNAEVAVGVTGLCLQFSTLVWLSASSISSATTTRIANALGKGDSAAARRLTRTALGMVLASQTAAGLAAYSCREQLVGLMTNQADVLALTSAVMPTLAVCFIFDGQNAVLSSVLRGAGRQWTGAGLNLLGWWGVGVPLAYYLAIPCGWNVPGLWAGFATASALQAVVQHVVVAQLDWEEEVKRARELVSSQDTDGAAGAGGDDARSSSSSSSGGSRGGWRQQGEVLEAEVVGCSSGSASGRGSSTITSAAAAGRRGGSCGGMASGAGTAAVLAALQAARARGVSLVPRRTPVLAGRALRSGRGAA